MAPDRSTCLVLQRRQLGPFDIDKPQPPLTERVALPDGRIGHQPVIVPTEINHNAAPDPESPDAASSPLLWDGRAQHHSPNFVPRGEWQRQVDDQHAHHRAAQPEIRVDLERRAQGRVHAEAVRDKAHVDRVSQLLVRLSGVVEPPPARREPDLAPSGVHLFGGTRSFGDERFADDGLNRGVCVSAQKRRNGVAGVPTGQVREMAVRRLFVVAVTVREFPFLHAAPFRDVDALVQTSHARSHGLDELGFGLGHEGGTVKDHFEDLVDLLVVVRTPEGRRSPFGSLAGVDHERAVVGEEIILQLGEPELRDASDERVALAGKAFEVLGVFKIILHVLHHPRGSGLVWESLSAEE